MFILARHFVTATVTAQQTGLRLHFVAWEAYPKQCTPTASAVIPLGRQGPNLSSNWVACP